MQLSSPMAAYLIRFALFIKMLNTEIRLVTKVIGFFSHEMRPGYPNAPQTSIHGSSYFSLEDITIARQIVFYSKRNSMASSENLVVRIW